MLKLRDVLKLTSRFRNNRPHKPHHNNRPRNSLKGLIPKWSSGQKKTLGLVKTRQ